MVSGAYQARVRSSSTAAGFDSWLEAIAARHKTCWRDLFDTVGLAQPRSAISSWIARLDPEEIAGLVAAAGIDSATLTAMTLDRFHTTALRIDPDTRTLDKTFPWSPSRYSRFCPQCLAANGGRWQLSWRLSWSFACLHTSVSLPTSVVIADNGSAPSPLPGSRSRFPGVAPVHNPGRSVSPRRDAEPT